MEEITPQADEEPHSSSSIEIDLDGDETPEDVINSTENALPDVTSDNVVKTTLNGDSVPLNDQTGAPTLDNLTEAQIDALVDDPNSPFGWAKSIEYKDMNDEHWQSVIKGEPLVLRNTTKEWDEANANGLFSLDFLATKYGDHVMDGPRNVDTTNNVRDEWTLKRYIDYMSNENKKRNLYGKDIECPDEWKEYVNDKLDDFFCYQKDDLVADLPKDLKPITLMIYVGYHGNRTPAHRDICGSLGHNVMVSCDEGAFAYWFLVKMEHEEECDAFWESHKCHIDHDNVWLPIQTLREAKFPIQVVKQKLGDFVLVPPEVAHQVSNFGGRSVKVAWNRVTPDTIPISYNRALPKHRRYCKPEVYRIKCMCFYGLKERIRRAQDVSVKPTLRLVKEFDTLIEIAQSILWEDQIDLGIYKRYEVGEMDQYIPNPKKFKDDDVSMRRCNFCSCDIWNRCFHCDTCSGGDFDLCMHCYAYGRRCQHEMELYEYFSMQECQKWIDEGIEARAILMKDLVKSGANLPSDITAPRPPYHNTELYSSASVAWARNVLLQVGHDRQEHGKITCHQCKRSRMLADLVWCMKPDCGHRGTKKRFCLKCLWNRYLHTGYDISCQQKPWSCHACTKICNCKRCIHDRGEDWETSKLTLNGKLFNDLMVFTPSSDELSSKGIAYLAACDVPPKQRTPGGVELNGQQVTEKYEPPAHWKDENTAVWGGKGKGKRAVPKGSPTSPNKKQRIASPKGAPESDGVDVEGEAHLKNIGEDLGEIVKHQSPITSPRCTSSKSIKRQPKKNTPKKPKQKAKASSTIYRDESEFPPLEDEPSDSDEFDPLDVNDEDEISEDDQGSQSSGNTLSQPEYKGQGLQEVPMAELGQETYNSSANVQMADPNYTNSRLGLDYSYSADYGQQQHQQQQQQYQQQQQGQQQQPYTGAAFPQPYTQPTYPQGPPERNLNGMSRRPLLPLNEPPAKRQQLSPERTPTTDARINQPAIQKSHFKVDNVGNFDVPLVPSTRHEIPGRSNTTLANDDNNNNMVPGWFTRGVFRATVPHNTTNAGTPLFPNRNGVYSQAWHPHA